MTKLLLLLLIVIPLQACHAEEPVSQSPSQQSAEEHAKELQSIRDLAREMNGGKEPTKEHLWKALVQKAKEHAELTKNHDKPRIVPKGAKPEILVYQDYLLINGHKVKIGDPLKVWKKAIDSSGKCITGHNNIICYWDALGIHLIAPKINNKVVQLSIHLNFTRVESWEKGTITHRPDGTPVKPDVKSKPDNPFTGYLAIDGYGIDAATQFWEVKQSVSPERNVRCGLRDCSHPHGRALFFSLANNKETAVINKLSITE